MCISDSIPYLGANITSIACQRAISRQYLPERHFKASVRCIVNNCVMANNVSTQYAVNHFRRDNRQMFNETPLRLTQVSRFFLLDVIHQSNQAKLDCDCRSRPLLTVSCTPGWAHLRRRLRSIFVAYMRQQLLTALTMYAAPLPVCIQGVTSVESTPRQV